MRLVFWGQRGLVLYAGKRPHIGLRGRTWMMCFWVAHHSVVSGIIISGCFGLSYPG